MILVYLLLFFYTGISFVKKDYFHFLMGYLCIITKIFMLDTSVEVMVRPGDLCIFLNFLLLPVAYARNKKLFSFKGDILSKSIYIFFVFLLFQLIVTIGRGVETLPNSIKVIRISFLLLAFFLFRFVSVEQFKRFVKAIFFITLFQSLLYFLQFLGIHLLADAAEADSIDDLGIEYALNIPTFTLFFLFLTLKANFLRSKRVWFMVLLLAMIFLTFVRGLIISIILGFVYYVFQQDNKKQRIQVIIAILFLLPIVSFVIGKKSQGADGASASGDISYVFNNISDLSNIDRTYGNFTFRIAMLAERAYYIIENPQYLLLGVGTMHEQSPRTVSQFNFHIGTVNQDLPLGRTVIETPDITWSPIVLRYGLLGVLVHLWMLIVVVVVARKRSDVLMVLGPLFVGYIFSTFGGNFFNNPERLFFLALFYAMLSRTKIEQRYLII